MRIQKIRAGTELGTSVNGKNIQDISLFSLRDKLAVMAKVEEVKHRAAISHALAKDTRIIVVEGGLDASVSELINSLRTVLWKVDSAHLANVQEGINQWVILSHTR